MTASRYLLPAAPIAVIAAALALAGCVNHNELDDTLGLRITRSTCPAVAIPAYTGDLTSFAPAGGADQRALDLSATITNLRSTCDEAGATVQARATFDVEARRQGAGPARDVALPYFATVLRAGTRIMSKQVGEVTVHFAAGQARATAHGVATAAISKAAASIPPNISARLNRRRKPTDADASIDPMSDPRTRAAVQQASFELLVGFQLSRDQLAYNATR